MRHSQDPSGEIVINRRGEFENSFCSLQSTQRCFQVGAQSMMVPDPNLSELFSQMSDRDICHNPCPGGFCRIPCDDNFGCSPVTLTFWSLSRFWREGPESVTDLGILMSSISFLYMLTAPSAVCHPLVKLKTNLESNKSFEN